MNLAGLTYDATRGDYRIDSEIESGWGRGMDDVYEADGHLYVDANAVAASVQDMQRWEPGQ